MEAPIILQMLDFLGVAVFAVSGALAAGRRSLDLLGVAVVAIVAAIGGGTLRDLLLDRPPFWLSDSRYLLVCLGAALLTVAYARRRAPQSLRALQIADALGLALFSISGAQIAQQAQLEGALVVAMGTITGAFGGVLRDVLCAQVPTILRAGDLYATAAIAGTSAFVLLQTLGLSSTAAAAVGMIACFGLRLASIHYRWSLPVFSLPNPHDGDDSDTVRR